MPVFLRVVENSTHTDNHKQGKVALREEGVDPEKIGSKVSEGKDDRFFWLLPDGDGYKPFGGNEWGSILDKRVRL